MNKNDQKFNTVMEQLQELRLSADDARDMRERLVAYADLHAVSDMSRAIPSPFFYWRMGTIAAAIVLLIGGGVGVSYASQNSLPGQPFYQVKVSVIEPVQGALIPSTEGKATWENVLAERRLSEASTLAAESKLSTTTSDYLAAQVQLHSDRAEADANALAASGNPDQALAVRSDLEARLDAHAALLALLAPRLAVAGDASSTLQVAILSQKVDQVRADVEQTRVATEVAISTSAASSTSVNTNVHSAIAAKMATSVSSVVAIADQQRIQEETSLFNAHVTALLALVPAATSTATTTATSSASVVASTTTSLGE